MLRIDARHSRHEQIGKVESDSAEKTVQNSSIHIPYLAWRPSNWDIGAPFWGNLWHQQCCQLGVCVLSPLAIVYDIGRSPRLFVWCSCYDRLLWLVADAEGHGMFCMCLTCVWLVFDLCLTCVWHVFDMCLTCVPHVLDMCSTCVPHVFHMCSTCVP